MGKRRMLSTDIICSRKFTQMPREAQLLYMHLNSAADDDGFLQNAEWVCRGLGVEETSLSVLEKEGYAISFPSGVSVLVHWNVNNQIRKDRYQPTYYTEEKSRLSVDERGVYQLIEEKRETEATHNEAEPEETAEKAEKAEKAEEAKETEHAKEEPVPDWVQEIDESIEKMTAPQNEDSQQEAVFSPTNKKAYGNYENVYLTDEELEKLKRDYPDYLAMIENLSVKIRIRGYAYQDHFAVMVKWAKEDAGKKKAATAAGASLPAGAVSTEGGAPLAAEKPKYDFEAMKRKARENLMRDGA